MRDYTNLGGIRRIGDETIEDGAIYVLRSAINCRFYGPIDLLHIMSKHAGGQIRGYQRKSDAGGEWTVQVPNYTGHWPEIDQAVADLVSERVNGKCPQRQIALQLGAVADA